MRAAFCLTCAWIFCALLLFDCAHKVPIKGKQVDRIGYSYRIDTDGVVLLWLRERGARERAFQELCPVKKFFCASKETGETWEIERTKK